MQLALEEAGFAAAANEVPVGAVVVRNRQVIATGRNSPLASHDPTAHAEIAALRAAAAKLGNYRLDDCELFVTLEPCAMCSGAMLHARLKRVVFGAADPKTGAAGSVVDLFAQAELNHHTAVRGGVMAVESAALLQSFFTRRRAEKRDQLRLNHPLREDALRTPDEAFKALQGYSWQPRYLSDLPALGGLRMHYLDEGARSGLTYLCLHGNPTWSYLYRKMIPVFLKAGHRVIAPDLIGFGKSDKPKQDSFHTFSTHLQILTELVERLDLQNIVLVGQDWGGLLGLTLPAAAPSRYQGLLMMNSLLAKAGNSLPSGLVDWHESFTKTRALDVAHVLIRNAPNLSPTELAAFSAPFPDRGHQAGLRAFPLMVTAGTQADGAALLLKAKDFWRSQWVGKAMIAQGVFCPVPNESFMGHLQWVIEGCRNAMVLPDTDPFVLGHDEYLAHDAVTFFDSGGCLDCA